MDLSIIITACKTDFLVESIDSVLVQVNSDTEIICINITDKPLPQIDKRVQIIECSGVDSCQARDIGFSISTGNVIHFIEPGDIIGEECYANAISQMENLEVDYVLLNCLTSNLLPEMHAFEPNHDTIKNRITNIRKDADGLLNDVKTFCNKMYNRKFLSKTLLHRYSCQYACVYSAVQANCILYLNEAKVVKMNYEECIELQCSNYDEIKNHIDNTKKLISLAREMYNKDIASLIYIKILFELLSCFLASELRFDFKAFNLIRGIMPTYTNLFENDGYESVDATLKYLQVKAVLSFPFKDFSNVIPVAMIIFGMSQFNSAITAITSIICNASTSQKYHITAFCTDIDEANSDLLRSISTTNIVVTILPISNLLRNSNNKFELMKYCIPEILFYYKKIIYLDANIICLDNLSELFNESIAEKAIGLTLDLNSGVILFNTSYFVKQRIYSRFKKIFEVMQDSLFGEKIALEIVLGDNVSPISQSWNCHTIATKTKYQLQPKLIHFSEEMHPLYNPNTPIASLFWEYARKTVIYEKMLYDLGNHNNQAEMLVTEKNDIKMIPSGLPEKFVPNSGSCQFLDKRDNSAFIDYRQSPEESVKLLKEKDLYKIAWEESQFEFAEVKMLFEERFRLANELNFVVKELDGTRNSMTFRLGRVLTFLPRKLINIIKKVNGK